METNIDSVYAVGDVAEFPLFAAADASVNIQHWQMAHQHGDVSVLHLSKYYSWHTYTHCVTFQTELRVTQ